MGLLGKVSSKYSRGAEGEVTVVQDAKKFPRGGDIWRGYEWPALVEERKVTSINIFSMDQDGKILENVTLDPAEIEARKLFGED